MERLLIGLVITALGMSLWWGYRHWAAARANRAAPVDPILNSIPPNVPVIVYFTTPFCAPCKLQQQPALAQIAAQWGDGVRILKVDAAEQPAAADRWGVLSAPTTFVLDTQRRARFVNHGVASVETLNSQLAQI